jgi:NosR/NirI family nitrous oxide reductase transcriptional regulator
VVFIGWYSLAQLSVLNVFTFVRAFLTEFHWETFLIAPMTFVLWAFVAMSLLLWGRGVYCGWLCPYGALQELVNKLAKRLAIPQFIIGPLVHDRLIATKYAILLMLFGLSLYSLPDTARYAEVEPFKTAITLRFLREWPFVLYAGGLIAVSAVNGNFFCKYLCPLGAALTIGGHFRIFDWLRRRKECGRPCQTCATECPSQAIRPTGEINPNECHYCLDCQMTFWNSHKCPPLVERRKRFERHGQSAKLQIR